MLSADRSSRELLVDFSPFSLTSIVKSRTFRSNEILRTVIPLAVFPKAEAGFRNFLSGRDWTGYQRGLMLWNGLSELHLERACISEADATRSDSS